MQKERKSGIYCIENIITNKKYIGQSIDVNERWRKHISELNHNYHHNDYLQKAWNKYGEDSFKFYVLEYCDCGDLLSYIKAHGPLQEDKIRVIGGCIVSAIGFMHSHHFLHRDIKPGNILLSPSADVVVFLILSFFIHRSVTLVWLEVIPLISLPM